MEIFEKISAHYIKGMMLHDKLANYYDFLGMRGYKRYHEHQFYCDCKAFRKLNRYYINHYSRLIAETEFDEYNIIPNSWYRYKREEVDTATKKNAVETAMQKWIEWETETKKLLENSIKELDAPLNALSSGVSLSSVRKGLRFLKTSFSRWPKNMPLTMLIIVQSPFFLSQHQSNTDAIARGIAIWNIGDDIRSIASVTMSGEDSLRSWSIRSSSSVILLADGPHG